MKNDCKLYLLTNSKIELGLIPDNLNIDYNIRADIAQRFFSSEEAQALANTNGTEQRDLFYRIWVQKEALVKWMGHTLGSMLQRSCMSTDPKVAELTKAPPELAILPTMAFLQLPDLYFGAVAWAATDTTISTR